MSEVNYMGISEFQPCFLICSITWKHSRSAEFQAPSLTVYILTKSLGGVGCIKVLEAFENFCLKGSSHSSAEFCT